MASSSGKGEGGTLGVRVLWWCSVPPPLGGQALRPLFHHSPLLGFAQILFSQLEKTQGQEQRVWRCLPPNTICFLALKPAREKLPPSCHGPL